MNIKPKIGVGDIQLGMSRERVVLIWGEPASKSTFIFLEEWPEDNWDVWRYNNEIELNFHSDIDYRLGSINVESADALLDKIRIIGLSEQQLISRFPNLIADKDNVSDQRKLYDHEQLELSFWLTYNLVDEVYIGPEYDAEGENVIWPKKI